MKIKNFLIDLCRDEKGSISVKPVVTFVGSVTLYLVFIATSVLTMCYEGTPKFSDTLIYGIVSIVIAGMGTDTADKFSIKNKDSNPTLPPTP